MKIGMLCPYYETTSKDHFFFIEQMKKKLTEKGYDVDIISYKSLDVPYNQTWENICTATPLSYLFKKFFGAEPSINQIMYNIKLESSYKELRTYDLLWNNGGVWSAIFCGKMKQKYHIPYIHTYHKCTSPLMLSIGWTRPTCYVTSNIEQLHYLDRHNMNLWTECIPHGVNIKDFITKKQIQQIADLPQPVVITSERLDPFNRVTNIVEAVSKTKGSLVIASTGQQKDIILQMGQDLLDDRFVYLGPQPYENIPELYNSCDLYINASQRVAYPIHILRAMASGLPVVYHKDDNRMWFIDEAGHPTDCTCTTTLSKAINTAKFTHWADKPYRQAQKFSFDKTVEKYEAIIQKISS